MKGWGACASRLAAQYREIYRRWLRYRYTTNRRTVIDLTLLERTILDHLYTDTAHQLGLQVRRAGPVLIVEGRGCSFHTHGAWTDFDTMPLGLISGDKPLVRNLLQAAGLTVPEAATFAAGDYAQAWAYTHSLGGPVVTKPARGTSSGRGVTVGLLEKRRFRRAFSHAAIFCPDVLVERFVPGENYRFLVYKGRTISVLLRHLPAVIGDGERDLRSLIEAENGRRIRSSRWSPGDPVLLPLPRGSAAIPALARLGLTLASVPPCGTTVRLGDTCSYAGGASYEEWLTRAHPALFKAAERAAAACDLTLAGVDVIAPNVQEPGYAINEVNTTPSLGIHYFVCNSGEARHPIRTIFTDLFGLATETAPGSAARSGA